MKRLCIIFLSITILFASLYGSGKIEEKKVYNKTLNVSLLIPGFIGDTTYNDSILKGVQLMRDNLGDTININLISLGLDKESTYSKALMQAAQSDADIIITGTEMMKIPVEQIAQLYQNKKFILYDTTVDFSSGNFENVYAIEYQQNEAGYLAGVLAASITTSPAMEKANDQPLIGFIGSVKDNAILNSVLGFKEGAQHINPDIQIISNYVGSYNDVKTAYQQAFQQYKNGVDIIFTTGGPSTKGVIDAALETEHYVIGSDSDQAVLYQNYHGVKYILTSTLKNVGISLYLSVKKSITGSLPYGSSEKLGLATSAVGLERNDIYLSSIPASIQLLVEQAHDQILNGKITVVSTSSTNLL